MTSNEIARRPDLQVEAHVADFAAVLPSHIRPEVFSLPAIAHYQHRLVIDLYPGIEEDPLLSFLASLDKERAIPPSAARAPEIREPGRPAGSVGEPARAPGHHCARCRPRR